MSTTRLGITGRDSIDLGTISGAARQSIGARPTREWPFASNALTAFRMSVYNVSIDSWYALSVGGPTLGVEDALRGVNRTNRTFLIEERSPPVRVGMSKGGRMVGAAVILVGAILMIVALFTPWYMEQISDSGRTITLNSYPGMPSTNGTIQYSCSGLPSGYQCPSQTSYSADHLNNTGTIAETGYYLIILGFIFGLIGAILGFASGNKPGRARSGMTMAIVAMVVAIAAVGMFAVALPTAIGQDTPNHTGTGPWSSFYGSGNASSYGLPGGTLSWGPATGWYLAIGAFVLFLVGMIILARARREPPEPAATAPAAAAPAAPPPAP